MRPLLPTILLVVAAHPALVAGQGTPPPATDPRVSALVAEVSAERIEHTIRTLVGFGTRHTLSDTLSDTRGIGAARRWLKGEFDVIAQACGGCLEVFFDEGVVEGSERSRIPEDVNIVNVVAVQRGTTYPNRYILITGHYDSRVSDAMDTTSDAPGANDDASGTAATLEAARVLSQYRFAKTLVYAPLAGEEQGLYGGRQLAQRAQREGWIVEAVLNNDIIGNIAGQDGVVDNTAFRVFSEPTPQTETEQERQRRRFTGGEVDGISRQLARYVDRITGLYLPNIDAVMIYRLDRFGRGGDHRRFNDLGFPAVRLTEMHENYTRQHQDIRTEDGIAYGDVADAVDFDYAARIVAVNVATMASLAWAPPPPDSVRIRGAVRPSTSLWWSGAPGQGYRVYWRETTAPQWTHHRWVGDTTAVTLENIVIDNYLFGVVAVGPQGNESVVVFPRPGR
ncbi:MAG: M28 family metallopeptidase [Gemmatimonadetes bacterium]|nr:M28 family metallopeptidase [Gemmatimonadota bacterium]